MSIANLVLSRGKFYSVRNRFYRQVESNPITAQLVIHSVADADAYSAFLGDSNRTSVTKTIRCLYDLQALGSKREAFGIEQDTEAVIHISPVSLFKLFGFYKFPDTNVVTVLFRDREYVISFARYLEEMFGDCISIQLELKTASRGG